MSGPILNQLRVQRAALGWSQAQVAGRVGISRQAYSAIEAGDAVPSTEVALRLARAFGRGVEELFQLGAEVGESVAARWSGAGPPEGRRVRLARVGEEVLAFEAAEGERRTAPADGVVVAHRGSLVEVSTLPDRPPEASLVAVGCDPAFAVVAEAVRSARGTDVLWLQRGSCAALEVLARGEAHVAGVHLREPATGEFNGPWIRRLVPFPCTVVRFAVWEQGILVGAGNPLGIRSVEDIARPTVRFLNREEGSGSRALLDESLASAGVPVGAVKGYGTGARSHLAVAEAISAGLADAGVGIRAAASVWGLDHLVLRQERYDLVVPDHFLDLPAVRSLLDVLRRPGLRAQVEALGGYDAAGIGEPV